MVYTPRGGATSTLGERSTRNLAHIHRVFRRFVREAARYQRLALLSPRARASPA